ncbi:MAG: hypothetical protein H0X29_04780 [Parachlamydiaceae bacterium]|nr:hypothetical protein [Parachlamydiaceae bacterium]
MSSPLDGLENKTSNIVDNINPKKISLLTENASATYLGGHITTTLPEEISSANDVLHF